MTLGAKMGGKLWRRDLKAGIVAAPVSTGASAFVADLDGMVHRLDLEDGRRLGRVACGSSVFSTPTISSGMLVVGSDDGSVWAFV